MGKIVGHWPGLLRVGNRQMLQLQHIQNLSLFFQPPQENPGKPLGPRHGARDIPSHPGMPIRRWAVRAAR